MQLPRSSQKLHCSALDLLSETTQSAQCSRVYFWGHVALIEGMIARIKAERNEVMTVVATGGVASLFNGATTAIDHFDPDLSICDLLEIYRRNAASADQTARLPS